VRWVTYRSGADDRVHPGVIKDETVHGSRGHGSLIELLAGGEELLLAAAERAYADPLEVIELERAVLVSPVPVPPSVRDFMAFEAHVVTSMAALGRTVEPIWYELPLFYFSNPAAVKGPNESVPISPGCVDFDFELEVAAVIGRPGADIKIEDAEHHIAGYVLFCDWSARDLQDRVMSQGLGPVKGKDGATSLGPWIVTRDELEPHRAGGAFDLTMTASVNGKRYSTGNLRDLYWSFAEMVAYASRGTDLVTGDLLGSGTVGTGCILELSRTHGSDAYPWLRAGDEVTLEVDRMGSIRAEILPAGPVVAPVRGEGPDEP
jgi:2-keto-4-pentenoate hydratase/2-oxohepta-3-ene-1,7-dioic acid hydratase in catechol pathway